MSIFEQTIIGNEKRTTNGKKNILLVEDSKTQALMISHMLSKKGYKVTLAKDGLEGLQMLKNEIPALVLSDIRMPIMNGFEMCREMKNNNTLNKIPIILLTQFSEPEDIIQGLNVGADNYITKPFNEQYLFTRIEYLLNNPDVNNDDQNMEIYFGGKNHVVVNCDRKQVFNFLISTLENAVVQYNELRETHQKLEKLNQELEEKIKERTKELSHSNEELEQFAYVASHDLKEPLRMISSFTKLLEKEYKDKLSKEANEYIQFTVDGAKRMEELINDLLEYSKIGSQDKLFEDTNCEHLLDQTIKNLKITIEEKKAVITKDPLPIVKADAAQLIQLFQNLISNSIKYCKESPPRVHVSAKQDKENWIFSVKDNGIGIAPEHKERIFQMFQRLHTRQEYSGTGIGLASCKKIIERHRGNIWVESELGKGSTFYFTIPGGQ